MICDWDHQVSEVRILPVGGGGNAIICKTHFVLEMNFRRERNKSLSPDCQFDLPKWEDLEVYE